MWTRLYQDQGKGAEKRDRQACRRLARQGERRESAGGNEGNTRAHRAWAEARTHVDVRRGGYSTHGGVWDACWRLEVGEGK
jgi:hypothetical protein